MIVVDESAPTCSMASEIAAVAAEDWETCRALRAPIRRVTTAAVPIPFSPPLEDFVLPDQQNIVEAVRESLGYAR
jgi:pyruvate dehydrogenase E1 component beta subunit